MTKHTSPTTVQRHWNKQYRNKHDDEFFNSLVDRWLKDISCVSSPTTMMKYTSFKAILSWGNQAVPKIVKRMKKDRRAAFLFLALQKITGEKIDLPERDKGKIDKVAELWIKKCTKFRCSGCDRDKPLQGD